MPVEPEASSTQGPPRREEEAGLVTALRDRHEDAFVTLVGRYHVPMLRLASMYVSRAVAEEVVQETWLGVLNGIRGFEARSSLRTWIFRILMNRTRTRMQRERRSIPFSALWDPAAEPAEPSVDPDRFLDATHPQWPHHWRTPPHSWGASPEDRLLSKETRAHIQQAIDALPPSQREVIMLRDVTGCTAEEVCEILSISDANQRVLLHRARSKVRRALEKYVEEP
jgi:RNA polymerase sigma-70 factor (ECF subfamily)